MRGSTQGIPDFSRDRIGPQPRRVAEYMRGDHQLIRSRASDKSLQPLANSPRRTNRRASEHLLDNRALMWHKPLLVVPYRRLKTRWPTAARVHERPLHGRSEEARFFVGVSGDNVEPQHDVRAGQLRGWLKMLPIDRERRRHLCRSEMRSERERQT